MRSQVDHSTSALWLPKSDLWQTSNTFTFPYAIVSTVWTIILYIEHIKYIILGYILVGIITEQKFSHFYCCLLFFKHPDCSSMIETIVCYSLNVSSFNPKKCSVDFYLIVYGKNVSLFIFGMLYLFDCECNSIFLLCFLLYRVVLLTLSVCRRRFLNFLGCPECYYVHCQHQVSFK